MLQYVAVCCSVLQGAAVCCSVLQYVAVCCSVLQCVAAGVQCYDILAHKRVVTVGRVVFFFSSTEIGLNHGREG